MQPKQCIAIIDSIKAYAKQNPTEAQVYEDWFQAVVNLRDALPQDKRFNAYKYSGELRSVCAAMMGKMKTGEDVAKVYDIISRTYLFEAKDVFDSYCIYLEWNRAPEKKFYQPRRKVLLTLVRDLEDLFNHKIEFLGVSQPPRTGKALSDDTPILTRNGWKNHGDLQVGDEVISPKGQFVKVLAVSPKCQLDVRCYFTDGTYIDCHENHEWPIYNRHKNRFDVIETKQMIPDYQTGVENTRKHRYHYQALFKNFVDGEYKKLPVPPYTLGAWLGDGSNQDGLLYESKQDRCIIERVISDGYSIKWHDVHKTTGVEHFRFDGLRFDLQKVGMCYSYHRCVKHIPEEYFTASISQRMELLAGLLDTDGSLRAKEHRYDFSTTESRLKDDFITLVSTFGWRCSVSEHEPCLSSGGIQGRKVVYVISFNPTCPIPCVVPRKQLKEFSKPRRVAFCGFERIEPKQGNCIQVEGGVYCAGKRLIPTHNSTLCIFFITWLMGNRPDVASVMSGHSDKLTNGFYGEVLSIITDPVTYNWGKIFPDVQLVDKSAKDESVDLNRKKRFPTLTCRSIGGTLTGAVEIGEGGVLYSDDLIEDLEESLNVERLNNKYDAYLNQLKDRKKQGALELMVGTRWNVLDPLGRIQSQYADNPKYRFRVIPAVDENGHSNFNYDYGVGFDDAYYADMKASIDDATWWAKYMGKPYVREGLLFPADELRYFNGVLPDGEPDRKLMVMDIAWGGGDFTSGPIAYVYNGSVFIPDVVFNNGDKTVTKPETVGKIIQHKLNTYRGEANNGGDEYCDSIDSMLRQQGYHCSVRSQRAPSGQSKLSRIIQYAPDIKRFYFLDEKHQSKEYKAFMEQVTMFTQLGKVPHDDAPDSLAQLADELYNGISKIEPVKRPF
jgi:predicted phage terminase large subunit-like protein|nr:MAG TPA: Terminase [Caudoviricetes sp.]